MQTCSPIRDSECMHFYSYYLEVCTVPIPLLRWQQTHTPPSSSCTIFSQVTRKHPWCIYSLMQICIYTVYHIKHTQAHPQVKVTKCTHKHVGRHWEITPISPPKHISVPTHKCWCSPTRSCADTGPHNPQRHKHTQIQHTWTAQSLKWRKTTHFPAAVPTDSDGGLARAVTDTESCSFFPFFQELATRYME